MYTYLFKWLSVNIYISFYSSYHLFLFRYVLIKLYYIVSFIVRMIQLHFCGVSTSKNIRRILSTTCEKQGLEDASIELQARKTWIDWYEWLTLMLWKQHER